MCTVLVPLQELSSLCLKLLACKSLTDCCEGGQFFLMYFCQQLMFGPVLNMSSQLILEKLSRLM